MLPFYRYKRILCCFIVLHNYGYTIVLSSLAHKALLQDSYLLLFCLYLTFKTYIFVLDGTGDLLMLSLDLRNGLLQLSCSLTTLLNNFFNDFFGELFYSFSCFGFLWILRQFLLHHPG